MTTTMRLILRVNHLSNIKFSAQYRLLTNRNRTQIEQMYNSAISSKKAEFNQQKQIVEDEIRELNALNSGLYVLDQSRKMTLGAIDYMTRKPIQESIKLLPKQDTVVLYTPDVENDLAQMPYLSYVEGKKPLFSKSVNIPSDSFKTCYFEDENYEFDSSQIDNWFKVLNGKI